MAKKLRDELIKRSITSLDKVEYHLSNASSILYKLDPEEMDRIRADLGQLINRVFNVKMELLDLVRDQDEL